MPTLAFLNLGPLEIGLLLIFGLLIFGRKLPEVGKNLGKGIVEFKKGLSGIEEDVKNTDDASASQKRLSEDTTSVVDKSDVNSKTNV